MANKLKLLIDGPRQADTTIVLAHGAGAAMDTEFMNILTRFLNGCRCNRFTKIARIDSRHYLRRTCDQYHN